MNGKICMVTGANAGIGKATAAGLAEKGATVIMVCRSEERGEAARREIIAQTGKENVALYLADLSSQTEIRRLVENFKQDYSTLDVLINNAGIVTRERRETEDGLEMQFAVNHLAYFLLTNLLLDVLKASAPARIVNVSSQTHAWAEIDFDDLQHEQGAYRPNRVYAETKLMNVLFTYELARRLEGTGVTANCLHPGSPATKLNAAYGGREPKSKASDASLRRAAQTSIHLASSPDVEGVSGQYFVNCHAEPSAEITYNEDVAAKLWRISAELTGLAASAD